MAAEHFDAAPTVWIFTTSLNSCGCLYDRCLLSMLPSHDPLPFIRLIVSQNQAVWARASGTDCVKSAVDVSSSALYRLTIRIRSEDTIRPNMNTLFIPLFGTKANTKWIFGTSLDDDDDNDGGNTLSISMFCDPGTGSSECRVQPHCENGPALGRRDPDVALSEHEGVERQLGKQARASVARGRRKDRVSVPHRRLQGRSWVHRRLHIPFDAIGRPESVVERGNVS